MPVQVRVSLGRMTLAEEVICGPDFIDAGVPRPSQEARRGAKSLQAETALA